MRYFLFVNSMLFCVFWLGLLKADEYTIGELYENQNFVITSIDDKGNPKDLKETGKGVLYKSKTLYGIKNLKCNVEDWIISRGTCVTSDYFKEYELISSIPIQVEEKLIKQISDIIKRNNYIPIGTLEIKNYNEMKDKVEKSLIIAKDISLLFDNTDKRLKHYEEEPVSVCIYVFSSLMVEKILLDNKISFEDCVIGATERDLKKHPVEQIVKR